MKNGANFKDRNEITRMAESGASAGEISQHLQIAEDCVVRFMPKSKAPFSVTDAAEKLAMEAHIDLSTLTGTGKNGGITKEDVQAAIDAQA